MGCQNARFYTLQHPALLPGGQMKFRAKSREKSPGALSGDKIQTPPREYKNSLEASYWHLLEFLSHDFLQKVRG